MRTYVCPGCDHRVEAIGQPTHRCPRRRNQATAYAPVETPSPAPLADQTATDEALAARLKPPRPRPSGPNAIKVTCGCRSIRAFPKALKVGPITCGACGGDFK
jgi:hypothetical protein